MWCCSLHFKGYRAFIWRVSGPRIADAYVYRLQMTWKWGEAVSICAQLWHCCPQTVFPCESGPSNPEVEGTIFFSNVKSPGVFTQRQTKRYISRDSHWHLLTTMKFQDCKIITSPPPQTSQRHTCLCARRAGQRKSRGTVPVIPSFSNGCKWVVSFTPQPL
jgi:hypothetical protein